MVSFPSESQRPVCCSSVTWFFVVLAALCCCNGLPPQETAKKADTFRGASESSRMPDTTGQLDTAALDLGSLLDAGDGAVITLKAGDTKLAAHRAVLTARSPVFAARFRSETLEASYSEVAIPDMEGPVLRQLVAYLYTGRAPQLSGMAPQLLAAADQYGVSALSDTSEQQVLKHLDVESAAVAAVVAIRHSRHSLRKAAITFIKAHVFEVLVSQGWADAVINHPHEVVQIYNLLAEPPAETSTIAIAHSMSTTIAAPSATTTATSTDEDSKTTAADSTPTTTAAPTTAIASTTATPTTTERTSFPTATTPATNTATAQPNSDLGRTAAPQLPTAGCRTPPLGASAISHLRTLSTEEKGRRLIHSAKVGSVPEVRALLAAGSDPRVADWRDDTALDWAAYHGHYEAALCLLLAGADVDAADIRLWTPLHDAILAGHPHVVRLLLVANANRNARDQEGRTPLHFAALHNRAVEAAALLQAGVDVGVRDIYGQTALELARSHNRQQVVRVLESHTTNN